MRKATTINGVGGAVRRTVSMSATCPRNRLKKIFRSWMPRRMYEAPEVCEVEDTPNSQSGASLSCTRPGTGVWLSRTKTRDGRVPFGASVSVPPEGIVAFSRHGEENPDRPNGRRIKGREANLASWAGPGGFGRVALRTCERVLRTLVGVA
jgi:hypothetical protein